MPLAWITCTLLALATTPVTSEPAAGTAARAETASFIVVNYAPGQDAREVAAHCEAWKARLQDFWCGSANQAAWSPKCRIALHASRDHYLAVVGWGGAQTYGSSLLDFGDDREVSKRQIDLRGDSPLGLAALPHEMTHVILADLLDGRQPPRWADEGMATLADTHDKQMRHERDLAAGLANRAAFRVGDLMSIETYPHPSRIPAFYGQSVSLTAFLALRDDPAKFVEFLRRGMDGGYDQALREVYAIDGVTHLERIWHEQRAASRTGYHGLRLSLDDATASRVGKVP
jgi:hypothetical protein